MIVWEAWPLSKPAMERGLLIFKRCQESNRESVAEKEDPTDRDRGYLWRGNEGRDQEEKRMHSDRKGECVRQRERAREKERY